MIKHSLYVINVECVSITYLRDLPFVYICHNNRENKAKCTLANLLEKR